MAEPGALQLDLSFDKNEASLVEFRDGEFCGTGPIGCAPYSLPFPFTTLQSGHSLTINPESPANWNSYGQGQMAVVDVSNAANPLTDAYIAGTNVIGTEELVVARVTLKDNFPPHRPFKMTAKDIIVGVRSNPTPPRWI